MQFFLKFSLGPYVTNIIRLSENMIIQTFLFVKWSAGFHVDKLIGERWNSWLKMF